MEETAGLKSAASRHAVSEWRDRHILTAGALVNRRAGLARKALDGELVNASALDSLFNPARYANARVDELMSDDLMLEIEQFLATAARDLRDIDASLRPLADTLLNASIDQPDGDGTAVGHPILKAPPVEPERSASWQTDLSERLKKGAGEMVRSTGAATDTVINKNLGMIARIRAAADRRIEAAWLNDSEQPAAVLFQLIDLIDMTGHEARVRLS